MKVNTNNNNNQTNRIKDINSKLPTQNAPTSLLLYTEVTLNAPNTKLPTDTPLFYLCVHQFRSRGVGYNRESHLDVFSLLFVGFTSTVNHCAPSFLQSSTTFSLSLFIYPSLPSSCLPISFLLLPSELASTSSQTSSTQYKSTLFALCPHSLLFLLFTRLFFLLLFIYTFEGVSKNLQSVPVNSCLIMSFK